MDQGLYSVAYVIVTLDGHFQFIFSCSSSFLPSLHSCIALSYSPHCPPNTPVTTSASVHSQKPQVIFFFFFFFFFFWCLRWEFRPLRSSFYFFILSSDSRNKQPISLYLLVFQKCVKVSLHSYPVPCCSWVVDCDYPVQVFWKYLLTDCTVDYECSLYYWK